MKTKTSKTVPIGGVPAAFKNIEAACYTLADDRACLASLVKRLKDRVRTLTEGAMPEIRDQAETVNATREQLATMIDMARGLFEKPKTRVFYDIKVGLRKQEGEIVIESEEKTQALIEKHFPDRLDELAPATRKLSKKALANLTATELKKIGVEITADTDAVIVKPQDSDVDKAVAALLAECTEENLKAAA